MKKLSFLITILLIHIITNSVLAASADKIISENLTNNMLSTITTLSSYPRGYEDDTITYARDFIENVFKDCGLEVKRQEFDVNIDNSTDQIYKGINIIGTKKASISGNNDILFIGAHYDGANGYPAANDNGSGVAVMLELAKIISNIPTDTEIRFIAFDAEEVGLYGSTYYANSITEEANNVIGMINFDMLASKNSDGVRIYSADESNNYLFDILKSDEIFKDIVISEPENDVTSDYAVFQSKLIPTISFSNKPIKEEMHNGEDTINNIDPTMLGYSLSAGLVITEEIMSISSPSYHDKAKKESNNNVYKISDDIRFPIGESKEIFEKELGIELTQMVSDNINPKYFANIKIFDIEEPMLLIAETSVYKPSKINNNITNCYIKTEASKFREIYDRLETMFGDCDYTLTDASESYIWKDIIHGNRYVLVNNNDTLTINIKQYRTEQESYKIENGTLVRLEDIAPTVVIKVKENDEGNISYNITEPESSYENHVTENAIAVWEKLKIILSDEELEQLKYLSIASDGLGGDEPIKIMYPSYDINQTIEQLIERLAQENLNELEISSTPNSLWIYIDYLDFLSANGSACDDNNMENALSIARIKSSGPDAPSEWAKNDIISSVQLNILPYELRNNYKSNITRLDFCQIAYQILKDELKEIDASFTDTNNEIICSMASAGIITGKAENIFAPTDTITREEAAAIISRMADYLDISADIDNSFKYGDDDNISDWAKEAVYKTTALGIMNGVGNNTFEPQKEYTKEQAIVTIMRLYDMI